MHFLDPTWLIDTFGLAGLLAIIFLESGLFPAPLPGDSLLFTAGLFAAAHKYGLHIVPIAVGALVCAIAGAQIGYEIGERYGTRLFKPGARFFKPEYEERSHEFFERQGFLDQMSCFEDATFAIVQDIDCGDQCVVLVVLLVLFDDNGFG